MTCGIYCFTIGESDKPYIGQSTNIGGRICTHKRLIKDRKASKKIQTESDLYGQELNIIVLEECEEQDLDIREIYWIKEFNSVEEGLNTSKGGEAWGGSGINGGNASYTKEEILSVFELLLKGGRGFKDIAKITEVGETIVSEIYKGRTHLWLKEEFPEKYIQMQKTPVPRSTHMDSFFIQHKDTKEIVEVKKRNETADKLNINRQGLSMVKSGKRKHTGGWYLYKEE